MLLISEVSAASVHPDCLSCTAAIAVASTALSDHGGASTGSPARATTSAAAFASPAPVPANASRSTSRKNSSRVLPVDVLAGRVFSEAALLYRGHAQTLGARPSTL